MDLRVAIDSISSIFDIFPLGSREIASLGGQYKEELMKIRQLVEKLNGVLLLSGAAEIIEHTSGSFTFRTTHNNIELYIVRGIIFLGYKLDPRINELERFLQIIKMRGTNHPKKRYAFLIDEGGLEILGELI